MEVIELSAEAGRVTALIDIHSAYCAEHTPAGSGHAVNATTPDLSDMRYWVATIKGDPVGCIGMKSIADRHAEIKTMHVLQTSRGAGVGKELLSTLIEKAQSAGFSRLSLETGKSEGFAASRRLYKRLGFQACPPFGNYTDDPFSYCMTREL